MTSLFRLIALLIALLPGSALGQVHNCPPGGT